jgi:hypothetical protein
MTQKKRHKISVYMNDNVINKKCLNNKNNENKKIKL